MFVTGKFSLNYTFRNLMLICEKTAHPRKSIGGILLNSSLQTMPNVEFYTNDVRLFLIFSFFLAVLKSHFLDFVLLESSKQKLSLYVFCLSNSRDMIIELPYCFKNIFRLSNCFRLTKSFNFFDGKAYKSF